ncbi:hypothetical protein PHYC_01759 [Phycisphaerales bacterium]|nr:hypothetical protein PHYC_01759 [Phycisphaerales bacterium]
MRHLIALLLAAPAFAQTTVFTDTFDSGPSVLWENQRGDWTASGGVYFAQTPSNSPPTLSTVPFVVGDCDIDVDVVGVIDGGIWVHVDQNAQNGVLLVTGGDNRTGRGLYWHAITNGGYSGSLGRTGPLFNQGDTIHVTIKVRGDIYAAYVNNNPIPATILNTGNYPAGRAGVYDYTAQPQQAFDNFVLTLPPLCDPDVNCDGAVNGFDIEVMEQAVNGDLTNFCQLNPDYNHDGSVNGFDVEAVEQGVNGAPC